MSEPIQYIAFGDIVEKNGRTIRQNNMEIPHNIPLGTLVHIKRETWHSGGACSRIEAREFVVEHLRDCDGSPLYGLAHSTLDEYRECKARYNWVAVNALTGFHGGVCESSMTPVEITPEVLSGEDALRWDEDG